VADFKLIKDEFSDIFIKTKLDEVPSTQEPSIFTFQNQKEVFQEKDFLEGLEMCKSQYDLVETFPVVGYSLKVKRYDGSMVNPWKVIVSKLARHHKSIDSMYLAKNQNKFELHIGENSVEEINAVLPLYTLKDAEMAPLLNSKLFRLAVSFMTVQNSTHTIVKHIWRCWLTLSFIYCKRRKANGLRTSCNQYMSPLRPPTDSRPASRNGSARSKKIPLCCSRLKRRLMNNTSISPRYSLSCTILRKGRLSHDKLMHLVDLALCHYTEKTFVENEFKLAKIV
jgi:hypothetical protein